MQKHARVLDHAERLVLPKRDAINMSITTKQSNKIVRGLAPLSFKSESAASPLIEEGRFLVSPEIAMQILENFNFRNQRSVSAVHIQTLAAEMADGNWLDGSQIAFAMLPDKSLRLINGQHRLHAVIASNMDVEFQVMIVPVSNDQELRSSYYRFDTIQRTRSSSSIMASTELADAEGISKGAANSAYAAGVIVASGMRILSAHELNPSIRTPDGKLKAIQPWWPYVKQYDHMIRDGHNQPGNIRRRLLLPSIMAVAIVTLKHQPTKGQAFWSGVIADDGLTRGDPRKAMLNVLSIGGKSNKVEALPIYASHCWNAWFLDKKLDFPKVHEASVCSPLGTPFAKP